MFINVRCLISTAEHCCFRKVASIRCSTYHSIKDIQLASNVHGRNAKVKGWVKGVRKMKNNVFIDVDDGSSPTKLQIVVPKEMFPESLTYGSSIKTSGKLTLNPNKQLELIPDDVQVVGPCVVTEGFPFVPRKAYHPDYVRQFIHMRPRTRAFSSLLRVRHYANRALDQYFNDSGFFQINAPVLTSNDCEGAGEVFLVKPDNQQLIQEMASEGVSPDETFFNGKTYLTVSGQMHLEVAARALNKVYCFGPSFRAENARSRLHLSEFYMAEAELAFTENIEDILRLIEGLIKYMCINLMEKCAEDIQLYIKTQDTEESSSIERLIDSPFTVDSYDNVCDFLELHKSSLRHPLTRGEPLNKEHELFLVKNNNNIPIFVIDWPSAIKPFYMKGHKDNPSKVHAVDLLCANVGELCGGSLREDEYGSLEAKLKTNSLEEKLAWYLELRKFGNVPTGGFGMGFERFLQVILGIQNIKDAIPFPRWPHNCQL